MLIRSTDAVEYTTHGAQFRSYLQRGRGSANGLRAWELRLPPHQVGVSHRPSHEESMFIVAGHLKVTIDGVAYDAAAGDVVHVSAGAQLRVDTQEDAARAFVTTMSGLEALMPDGTSFAPPWAE